MFETVASATTTVLGIIGFSAVALAIYWLFNKRAKARHLEELRRRYESMSPTDPNYNAARALFIAASISSAAASAYANSASDSSVGHGDGGEAGGSE